MVVHAWSIAALGQPVRNAVVTVQLIGIVCVLLTETFSANLLKQHCVAVLC